MDALFGKTINMLSAILDFRSERHRVIASNIANIDTPNYKPKELVSKKELEDIIDKGKRVTMVKSQEKHLSGQPIHCDKTGFEVVNSGEKVNIDKEMAKLAGNNLMYNLTVELLMRKFKGLNSVLREAK